MHVSDASSYDLSDEDENVIYRNDNADDGVEVKSAADLEWALNEDSILYIYLGNDITWSGDLLISGKYVTGWCSLTVSAGSVTVEDGGLGLQGGDLYLENGSSLAVRGLGKVYANNLYADEGSTITVDASSVLIAGSIEATGTQIDLNTIDAENGDASIIAYYGMSLTDCLVTLGTSNSYLISTSIEQHGSTTIDQNEGTITEWNN